MRLASASDRGAQIGVQNFLDNQRMTYPKTVECLPPLLQPKHLLNLYFKRHYDVCKGCASLAIHNFYASQILISLLLWNSVDG